MVTLAVAEKSLSCFDPSAHSQYFINVEYFQKDFKFESLAWMVLSS